LRATHLGYVNDAQELSHIKRIASSELERRATVRVLRQIAVGTILRAKSQHWAHESEWRLILLAERSQVKVKLRPSESLGLAPFVEIRPPGWFERSFKTLPLVKVVIGPKSKLDLQTAPRFPDD
jgi:hypothetical protein